VKALNYNQLTIKIFYSSSFLQHEVSNITSNGNCKNAIIFGAAKYRRIGFRLRAGNYLNGD